MSSNTFFYTQSGKPKRFHLLGICGSGMKPLAKALMAEGISVSGTDIDASKVNELIAAGIPVSLGHRAENCAGADCIVYSTAVAADNPEMVTARENGLEIVHRGRLLAEFLSLRQSVLVAGTHGKTTTTTMLSLILNACQGDPWCFVGGHVAEFGGNFRHGDGKFAVAEADESDGSFLTLPRQHAIITNIEAEHLNYWQSETRMFEAFIDFAMPVVTGGKLVVCADDAGTKLLSSLLPTGAIRYSIEDGAAHYYGKKIELCGRSTAFEFVTRDGRKIAFELGVPGKQNVANCVGALAMASELGFDVALAAKALKNFHGVSRRFTTIEAPDGYLIVDDYAHHPTEIKATLRAAATLARERGGRVLSIFQPHRYSRLASLFEEFGGAFGDTDELILTDVYAAGEAPIEGADSRRLATAIEMKSNVPVTFISCFDAIEKNVRERAKIGDIVLLLGAGSITNLAHLLSAPLPTDPALLEARH